MEGECMFWNFPLFKKKETPIKNIKYIKQHPIPKHIAIIMDGNGRWAKQRSLPRVAGHKQGMEVVKKIAIAANQIGVKVLTVYAFSTENWERPKSEVDFLMKLPEQFMNTFLPDLIKNNVQVQTIGRIDALPVHTKKAVIKAKKETENNNGLILNFALNYGSRDEMTNAIKAITSDIQSGKISINDLEDKLISNYLMTNHLPDPDLLIRTSGELRISNFMLWQIAYTELWFSEVCWPDFTVDHLMEAILAYQKRNRRYGGI
jgi:undecaprenyl diphosphate synthase